MQLNIYSILFDTKQAYTPTVYSRGFKLLARWPIPAREPFKSNWQLNYIIFFLSCFVCLLIHLNVHCCIIQYLYNDQYSTTSLGKD